MRVCLVYKSEEPCRWGLTADTIGANDRFYIIRAVVLIGDQSMNTQDNDWRGGKPIYSPFNSVRLGEDETSGSRERQNEELRREHHWKWKD